MAIGSSITFETKFSGSSPMMCPGAAAAQWVNAIDAGGMDDQDAATITNPATQITASTRHIVTRDDNGPGTLRARMAYAGTPSTDPVVVCFGRFRTRDQRVAGTEVAWQRLYNKAAAPATAVTLTTATASDVTDATMKYTECNPLTHAWDVDGCNEFVFGVQTAYAVSAGSAATAYLQVKQV